MATERAMELVNEVERLRRRLVDALQRIAEIEAEMAKSEMGCLLAALRQGMSEEKKQLDEAEFDLRTEALNEYAATTRKTGLCGGACGVRVNIALDYDAKIALDWAIEHRLALKLDVPAFEKILKASPFACADFVLVREVPQATIKSDLSDVVAG